MTAIIEIKLIMWTSIVDEQIEYRTQTRNMNSTTISNRKDRNTYGATGSSTIGVEVIAQVVEEEVAEVGEEVVVGEVVAASSHESALPKFQQRPPNGAQEGVAVGDVAAAEWSAGVAHEAVDGAPP